MKNIFFIVALFFVLVVPSTTFADVGKLNIQYTFIGDYSLPAGFTIVQKLSDGAQQTEGGTSSGNPGYILNVPFSSFNPDAKEYHVIFQPASPFVLQMSGDCEGQVPPVGVTRTCLATFRLPPPLAPTPAPAPIQSAPTCSEDIWSCGDYGVCSVTGIQSRSCTKTFDCQNVQTVTPTTDQSCQPTIQLQSIQVKQDSVTNSVLEKTSPKKSVATPTVTQIETKEQKNTKEEKVEGTEAPLGVIDQNTASPAVEKKKEVAKPSVVTRVIRWFLNLF